MQTKDLNGIELNLDHDIRWCIPKPPFDKY